MVNLEKKHPEAYQHCMDEGFIVQRSSTQLFAQVPIDQAIEQTVNKGTKSKGGSTGLCQAMSRWMITAH